MVWRGRNTWNVSCHVQWSTLVFSKLVGGRCLVILNIGVDNMNNNELIADKFEEVIGRMFVNFESFYPKASEYSIFFNPQKHPSWFILIFFADFDQLKDGIKNGVCYQIYTYLNAEFKKAIGISDISWTIFFESGNRPVEKSDIDNLFNKLIGKMEGIQMNAGKKDIDKCGFCSHDFNKHQLLLDNVNGKIDTTTEGWLMCPEEDCNCFGTWSVNSKTEMNSNG